MNAGTAPDWGIVLPTEDGLQHIRTSGRQLRDVSHEALSALKQANNPPVLFSRARRMVAVLRDEKHRQVIGEVTESALRGRLARSANYFRLTSNGKEIECAPPIEVVRDIQALEPFLWGFPPLDGVIEAPVLRPDGSLLDHPGYDPATQLYYAPDPELKIPPISENPTQHQIEAARAALEQAIGEFPFVEQASRSNALATMLTPIVRSSIDSSCPMALFDAPAAGTGKTLLADVISIVATGRAGEMFSAPRDEDEWRKQITMALTSGTSVVVIDNVNRRLDNSDLCKVLTETTHADRVFRSHEKLLLPVKSTWIATGNNIQLGGDMPRRCYWVRLDAETSQPFMRTGFKIDDLKQWVFRHRGELLASLLTLARAWYVAKSPRPSLSPLGSYEAWTMTIGGILQHAGIFDFLANSNQLFDAADTEAVQWETFLVRLQSIFRSEPFTVAKLAEKIKATTCNGEMATLTADAFALRAALPDFVAECLDRDGFFQRRIGKCFGERVDKRFGKSQVHLKRGTIANGFQQWRVVLPELE
jgi:hypothetical protein